MADTDVSTDALRRFYDRIGALHDLADAYERRPKALGLSALRLLPGQRVLNVGAGSGVEHREIVGSVRGGGGSAVAVDVSITMLRLVRGRTGSPVVEADARHLPFGAEVFDRVFCSYVLDLLPVGDLPGTIEGFVRVTKPGGLVGLVSMTHGVDRMSRLVVAAWTAVYRTRPILCGGCRPLDLRSLVAGLGLTIELDRKVVQRGFPSEVLVVRV